MHDAPAPTPLARLLHRWFVEYNPLYLLSAMLVLGGTILFSRGLAHEGSTYGPIAVAAIAELYAIALIGGAALLVRLGHRRSAVMLALLSVVYLGDLTLHTETCPNLGGVGIAATVAWAVVFVGKLHALGWAMRLRVPVRVRATVTTFGLGLALLPYALRSSGGPSPDALVMAWLFSLGALLSVHRGEGVESREPLDGWASVVLRRAVRASWWLWGGLLALHVLFWSTQYHLSLAAIAPAIPLALVPSLRRQGRVWLVTAATIAIVGLVAPSLFGVTALLGAAALVLRARAVLPRATATAATPEIQGPYRGSLEQGLEPITIATSLDEAARVRLLVGAASLAYLGVWTLGWTGGPFPHHVLLLDTLAALLAALALLKFRVRAVLAPLAALAGHLAVERRLVPAPQGLTQWGGAAIALGFFLLVISLAASYWLRPRRAPASPD